MQQFTPVTSNLTVFCLKTKRSLFSFSWIWQLPSTGDETEPNPTAQRKIILLTLCRGKLIAFHATNTVNFSSEDSVFFKKIGISLSSVMGGLVFGKLCFPTLGNRFPNLNSLDTVFLGWLHPLLCSRHFGQKEAQGFFLFVCDFLP